MSVVELTELVSTSGSGFGGFVVSVVESTVLVSTGGSGLGSLVVSVVESTVLVGTGGSGLGGFVMGVVKSTVLVCGWPGVGGGDGGGWRFGVCLGFRKRSSVASGHKQGRSQDSGELHGWCSICKGLRLTSD